MDRITLLKEYFRIDTSGNEIDGISEIYVRDRLKDELITTSKSLEFEYIMDILFPDWRAVEMTRIFSIQDAEDAFDVNTCLCICTQHIKKLCYLKHPSLDKAVQVGSECVCKISPELQKKAEQILRLKKKIRLDKERDELVSRVEKEYDEQMELNKNFAILKQRLSVLESTLTFQTEFFRTCISCGTFSILKIEPHYKTKCKSCYKI